MHMALASDVHGISTSEAPRHGHVLSDKSTELQRDTFELRGSHPPSSWLVNSLIRGLSFTGINQKLTPAASAILQRWARVIDEYPLEFYLRAAKVELLGIMSYSMSPSGPIVAPIRMILYPRQLRLDRAGIITV
jgi:hypothetical protein